MELTKPAHPRPSSSIILVSPKNDILMLKRTPSSSSYPSAWVFPGGNLSLEQDGTNNDTTHRDSPMYRISAIRELFEETGILLVKPINGPSVMVKHRGYMMAEGDRERGRLLVHSGQIRFSEWLRERGFVPDTDSLIPFTRWITPVNLRRRFTTQMYLYFLRPTTEFSANTTIPHPTPDGGKEHVSVEIKAPSLILMDAQAGSNLLMTPQFYLLNILSGFLNGSRGVVQDRQALLEYLSETSLGDRVICAFVTRTLPDGKVVLSLERSGPEVDVDGSGRKGDATRSIIMIPGAKDSKGMDLVDRNRFAETL
ncbi:hypothetical protein EJ04DRAFT_506533 [Polyplosphaeria fusca]|uniref:Nudix hydrolase domain-containing protein n=1 Tax=Polyplosphaeria fusca TaxID=682080 RepID=A0A9P4QGM8_9PLEO|nr:hypothetical protein EJ04DRAFT_506533 [Polyplosphaeria fusca]